MACRGSRARILFLMWCIAGSSGIYAQNAYLWDGLYAGVNAGGAHGSTCNQWAPAGTDIDSTTHSALTSKNCLNSNFLGGLQFGDSFQSGRFALGLGADFDIWHAAETSSTVVYSGAAIPRGTYTFSNRLNPARFAILGPRVGYAGNQWMPYLRVGAMLPLGDHDNSVYYTPKPGTSATASFDGGKPYSSVGWVAGAGASGAVGSCGGTAANCASFSGISFTDVRDASRADLFRVGVSYWFNFWD